MFQLRLTRALLALAVVMTFVVTSGAGHKFG
jgi:hypothetical protein